MRIVGRETPRLDPDCELVTLSDVAHVNRELEVPIVGTDPFAIESCVCARLQFVKRRVNTFCACILQSRDPGQAEIGTRLGDQNPERAGTGPVRSAQCK
jgi:hypothetical protein